MKTSHIAAIAAAACLAALQARADHTNLVQSINIQLIGVAQGRSVTNRGAAIVSANTATIDTRRVIAALGAATGNAFSYASRLALITPLDGGSPSVQVRDGAQRVDVTPFFSRQVLSDTVERSVTSLSTGRSSRTAWSIQRLALEDGGGYPALGLHFDVNGFTTETTGGYRQGLDAEVSGTGDREGRVLILRGSIRLLGQTMEVVGDDGGGPPT